MVKSLNADRLNFLSDLNEALKLFTEAITNLEHSTMSTINLVVPTISSLIDEINNQKVQKLQKVSYFRRFIRPAICG